MSNLRFTAEVAERRLKLAGKTLVIPVRPILGESAADLIMRALFVNGYPDSSVLRRMISKRYFRDSVTMSTLLIGFADKIADMLGLPGGVDDLRPLLQPEIPGRAGFVDFFGVPIRASHLLVQFRRVSPLALRRSLHSRAIWSLLPLPYDPETKQVLLDHCPRCKKKLRFGHKYGVEKCGYCVSSDRFGLPIGSEDLRDAVRPFVTIDDEAGLDLVSALVDPCLKNMGPEPSHIFANEQPGHLWEFVIAIAEALGLSAGGQRADRRFVDMEPRYLSQAGRVLIDWPNALYDVADKVRADSHLRNDHHYGIGKELGPLLWITHDMMVAPHLRGLLKQELVENMRLSAQATFSVRKAENRFRPEMISIEEASGLTGISRKRLSSLASDPRVTVLRSADSHSPVLLLKPELLLLIERSKQLLAPRQVAHLTGLSEPLLPSFEVAGLLTRDDSACSHLIRLPEPGGYYEKASTDRLIMAIDNVVRADAPALDAVRLSVAMATFSPLPTNRWPEIVAAIVKRRLQVWQASDTGRHFGVQRLYCSLGELLQLLEVTVGTEIPEMAISQSDAAFLLGTHVPNVNDMMLSGLLPRTLSSFDLVEFRRSYVLTPEIQRILAGRFVTTSVRVIRNRLEAQGVYPLPLLHRGTKLVWKRAEVDRIIDSNPLSFASRPGGRVPLLSTGLNVSGGR